MYEYRKLNSQQQHELLEQRRKAGLPLHQPSRVQVDESTFLISSANYEHQHIMHTAQRRAEMKQKILEKLQGHQEVTVYAWCLLPNHYHLLVQANLKLLAQSLGRLHNGTSTQWNREDQTPGRRVWYRLSDRVIRNERHFWTIVNYIHENPVKHGYVQKPQEWASSSIHHYLEIYGRETLSEIWRSFPVRNYGDKWDRS